MPRLKNVQSFSLSIINEPWLPTGVGMVWTPGQSKDVLATEFNRSPGLQNFVSKGYLVVVGQHQPGDTGPAPTSGAAAVSYATSVGHEPEPEPEPEPVEPDQMEVEPEPEPESPYVAPESRWSRLLKFLHLKS